MESIQKAIKEDLKAAFEAFKNDSFDNMNMFSNRVSANGVFGDDPTIFLIGFFMKDVAEDFMALKARKEATPYSTAKAHGFKYIESLEKSFPTPDIESLWKQFHEYSIGVRKFLMSAFEEKNYSDNVEFSRKASSCLIKFLKEREHILADPRNFLFKGVLNELGRIFRVHSGGIAETALYCMIKALDRYYDYCRTVYMTANGQLDEEKLRMDVYLYVDKIEQIYAKEFKTKEVADVMWKLVKGWREFYVQYMEPRLAPVEFEKGIELPPELKKKISESLSEVMEKKM